MDPSSLRVKISGPLLSKLMHERYRHSSNCGGLLYGQVISGTKSEITDSQHITKSEDYICIQDYLPLTNRDFFSKRKQSSSQEAWGDNTSHVHNNLSVGMYRIRNSATNLSLLEKSMHRKLCEELVSRNEGSKSSNCAVTLLVTCDANFDATCLEWKINAYIQEKSKFRRVKLEISNLQGSVGDLYINNPSPVSTTLSSKTESVLQSFQSSLTDDAGEIQVVATSRKVTQDLLSELDSIFEGLERSENALGKVLMEKSALLDEWNALLAKREERRLESIEKEYQEEKRRSLEDIRTRSSVVLLEKLEIPNAQSTESPKTKSTSQNLNGACGFDPFANLVSTVKEELKKDSIAEQTDRILMEENPSKPKSTNMFSSEE